MVISSHRPHADSLLSMEAEQLIERQRRRDIQYRLIFRQDTVRFLPSFIATIQRRNGDHSPWGCLGHKGVSRVPPVKNA
jgi:hypothetical protein